jgi:hypothetical protein
MNFFYAQPLPGNEAVARETKGAFLDKEEKIKAQIQK